jgi:hypothetical protein
MTKPPGKLCSFQDQINTDFLKAKFLVFIAEVADISLDSRFSKVRFGLARVLPLFAIDWDLANVLSYRSGGSPGAAGSSDLAVFCL